MLGNLLSNLPAPVVPDLNNSNGSNNSNSSDSGSSSAILASAPINTTGGEVLQVTVLDPARVTENTTVEVAGESGTTVSVPGNALQAVANATGSGLIVLTSSALQSENSQKLTEQANAEVEAVISLTFRNDAGEPIEAGLTVAHFPKPSLNAAKHWL